MPDAPLMLSVSGLRGLVGQSLTAPVAARYGAAFGRWIKSRSQDAAVTTRPHIVLGRDSRPSGQMIERAAAAGLIDVGCRVTTLGIVTTPGVAVMIGRLGADGGMVITASHNPIEWNGIKALRHNGTAPPPDQAQQIIDHFNSDDVAGVPVESPQQPQHNDETHQVHVGRVLEQVDVSVIGRGRIKVVLDSVHGAGGPATVMLLDRLGVELVHLYGEPTGRFPHGPEPTQSNLTGLCRAVAEHGADIGFAQDPDADRLAIVDETGRYIGEEYTLALCCRHMLDRQRGAKQGAVLATNLSTSRMIDDAVAQYGARVIRTPVGEANVVAAMQQHNALIGGEGNGGVIVPGVCHVRDSLIGIALMLEMLACRDEALSHIVDGLPRYAIVKDKTDLAGKAMPDLAACLRRRFAGQQIDLQDGVRIDWPDRWVHVRPSNTEPIMRIIAEASDESSACALISEVRQALDLAPA